jgi:uncharacterized protein YqgC (DUF456 family)
MYDDQSNSGLLKDKQTGVQILCLSSIAMAVLGLTYLINATLIVLGSVISAIYSDNVYTDQYSTVLGNLLPIVSSCAFILVGVLAYVSSTKLTKSRFLILLSVPVFILLLISIPFQIIAFADIAQASNMSLLICMLSMPGVTSQMVINPLLVGTIIISYSLMIRNHTYIELPT